MSELDSTKQERPRLRYRTKAACTTAAMTLAAELDTSALSLIAIDDLTGRRLAVFLDGPHLHVLGPDGSGATGLTPEARRRDDMHAIEAVHRIAALSAKIIESGHGEIPTHFVPEVLSQLTGLVVTRAVA